MTADNKPFPRPMPKLVESRTEARAAEPTAILVLGMHRSGTSALTRVVSLLGADLPRDLMPAKDDNAPGFWEAQDGHHLNDALLKSAGSRWDDWRALNSHWFQSAKAHAFRDQALEFLHREFADSPLFVMKDPRICRLLPFWLDVLEESGRNVRAIIAFRNPLEVAGSLRERNGFSSAKSHMLWLRHMLEAELATRKLPRAFLAYDELLGDWREVVGHLEASLGVAWPRWSATAEVEIDRFLNDKHRHHAIALDRLRRHPKISGWVKDAADSLRDLLRDPWSSSAQSRLDWIHADFDRASDALGAILRSEELAREEAEKAMQRHERRLAEVTGTLAEREERLAALAEAKAASEKQVAGLRDAHDKQAQRLVDVERQLGDAGAERERLSAELVRREQTEAGLLAEIDAGNRLSDELQEAVRSRDGRVDELQHQAAALASELAVAQQRFAQDLTNKDDEIVVLQTDLQSLRAHADELAAELDVRESRISSLEDELGHEREALALNSQRLEDSEAERQALEERGQHSEAALRTLQSELALRDARIVEADEALAESHALVSDLENDNRAKAQMLEGLRGDLEARERQVDELERLVGDKEQQVDGLERRLGDKEQQVDGLERRLADKEQVVEELSGLLAVRDRQLGRLNDAQRDAQANVRRLQDGLDAQQARLGELEQALSNHEGTIARLRRLLIDREQALADQMKTNTQIDSDLRQAHSDRLQLDVELSETKAAGESRSKRLLAMTAQRNQALHRINGLQKKRKVFGGKRARPPRKCFGLDLSMLQRSRIAELAETLRESRTFNESWYVETYPDVVLSGADPMWHWLLVGWREGRNPNLYFDVEWYMRRNPDVAKAGVNPLTHYLNHGAAEGRDPGPLFSHWWYLTRNPDVARAGVNPLRHYFSHGAKEWRSINPLFDPRRYVEKHPSAVGKTDDAFAHYLKTAPYDGYEPGALFDVRWYLDQNPDVAQSGLNPLVHYLKYGRGEGRKPNAWFDPSWYLEQYPDVAEAGLDPLEHYLVYGAADGRNPGPSFDSRWYLDTNREVAGRGVNPLVHFLEEGRAQGRKPVAGATASANAPGGIPTVAGMMATLPAATHGRPRIVFCSHDLKVQGAPKSLFEVVTGLAARGRIEPIVLSPYDGPLRLQYEARGVPIAIVEGGNVWNAKTAERFHRAVDVFTNAFAAINPAAVFANTFTMFHAVSAAQHLGLPGILNPRESEPPETFFDEFPEDIRSIAYRVVRTADKVVFVAGATRAQWEFANERANFAVIRNALPAEPDEVVAARGRDRESARRAFGIAADDLVFACVGTVTPRKGQLDIVEAYARLPDHIARRSRLLILGMAPNAYSEEISALVATMAPAKRERVALVPQTTSAAEASRVRDVYLSADVFILSSRIESYPRVILEAMSYGLPIITTPCFGVVEQVRDGKEALYYDEGDAEDLAIRMKILVDEPAFRQELAHAVTQRHRELGTHDDMLMAYETTICSVLPSGDGVVRDLQGVTGRQQATSIPGRPAVKAVVSLLDVSTINADHLSDLQWLAMISAEDHLLKRHDVSLGLMPYAHGAADVAVRAMPWRKRMLPGTAGMSDGPTGRGAAATITKIRLHPTAGVGPALADLLSPDLCAAAAAGRVGKPALRLSLGATPGQLVLTVIGSAPDHKDVLLPDGGYRIDIGSGRFVSPERSVGPVANDSGTESGTEALDAIYAADVVCLARDSAAFPLALAACVALDRPLVVCRTIDDDTLAALAMPEVATGQFFEALSLDDEARGRWLSLQAALHRDRCKAAETWLQRALQVQS